MKIARVILITALFIVLTGCAYNQKMDGDGMVRSYTQISQEEAMEMMQKDDGHVILDVRRQDEYDQGHIPGAILIPNETIDTEMPEELPDKEQIILIYCRRGNRSKEAAQKLFDMGYDNVYEFGGINTWTGEIVTEEAEEDVSMKMMIGETEVPVTWEENDSVEELKSLLPITVNMSMYGDFEQVGSLGQSIVRNDKQTTTNPGDIVLYSGDQIVVFYGSNSWSYTRLGHVDLADDELAEMLSNGDVTIKLY
ncbi:Rhodanese-related sulfurtransferase [Pseudobutyrivibrio sp. ACV-2]|uniref:cyclophilin-like fold protein n=1 Tax=Pseudobutyrivibrio sp. ACV-2 TaxID=1520801 RepID=UPI00089CDA56|nr:cyclophilin-like fold protein [Pseudobutyrivibrio sp. ACV-2]SEA87418.1 Rhodanese-related sulfurtransferase [Pseudobutyrivibrio sp. ACV-2]